MVAEAPPWYGEPTLLERMLSLVCGLPQERWEHNLMGMFTVYFDDSGSHRGTHRFVLGGYLSPVRNWIAFTIEWQRALKELGLKFFHMAEAEAKKESRPKPYDAWSDEAREKNITRLSEIVGKHAMRGLALELNQGDYQALVASRTDGIEDMGDIMGDPFNLLHQQSLYLTADICRSMGIRPSDVDIVYSDQPGTGVPTQISRHAAEVCGFSQPSFQPMWKLAPLQAADMIAWLIYKHWKPDEEIVLHPRHQALCSMHVSRKRLDAKTLADWSVDIHERLEARFGMTIEQMRALQAEAAAAKRANKGRRP